MQRSRKKEKNEDEVKRKERRRQSRDEIKQENIYKGRQKINIRGRKTRCREITEGK